MVGPGHTPLGGDGGSPIAVTHVITDLEVAGAQVLLHGVLQHTDRQRFRPSVVALGEPGPVAQRIVDLGVPVTYVHMRRLSRLPRDLVRAAGILRGLRPQVVQTWMYHADLIGGLAARMARAPVVVWGIHQSDLRPEAIRRRTRLVAAVNARLSHRLPDWVVCSSEATRRVHQQLGYPGGKLVVIRNGYPTPEPDVAGAQRVRRELGVDPGTPLVGRVGRFHPQKDYPTFIRAAGRVAQVCPQAHFLLCGAGLEAGDAALRTLIEATGHPDRFHLLGLRHDVPAIQAALDVAVSSSSFGESAPLVIGEAMAAGVPVVATDVGDSAWLLGDIGRVVPPEQPQAMADAVISLLRLTPQQRAHLGQEARRRVAERFSLRDTAQRYMDLHEGAFHAIAWSSSRG